MSYKNLTSSVTQRPPPNVDKPSCDWSGHMTCDCHDTWCQR